MYNISYSRPFLCLLSLLFLSFPFPFDSYWARSVSPSHIRLTLAGTIHPQFPNTSKIVILSSLPLDSLPIQTSDCAAYVFYSIGLRQTMQDEYVRECLPVADREEGNARNPNMLVTGCAPDAQCAHLIYPKRRCQLSSFRSR